MQPIKRVINQILLFGSWAIYKRFARSTCHSYQLLQLTEQLQSILLLLYRSIVNEVLLEELTDDPCPSLPKPINLVKAANHTKASDLVVLGQIKQNGSFRSHKSIKVMINSSSV